MVRGTFLGILGYSDDSLLLAPSLDSLQEMLKICEDYAETHNLRFNTDKNPTKCKIKCMAFLLKDRPLHQLNLCGNSLQWVSSGKQLGITLENKIDGLKADTRKKRAEYINKNNELLQEFSFSRPKTTIRIHSIYNSHLSGSCLWDLFSKEAVMMENSWNVSMRLMLDLPREAHRYLIETISETRHIKIMMMKRFLTFIQQIRNSNKIACKSLLDSILLDTRSTTGSNLRNILLKTDRPHVYELVPNDVLELKYHPIEEKEIWRLPIIHELIEAKQHQLDIIQFTDAEVEEMLYFL